MIVDIDIEKIKDFDNHPFKVVMDESMKELLQSVTINGIINPLIVRKKMIIMKSFQDTEENM